MIRTVYTFLALFVLIFLVCLGVEKGDKVIDPKIKIQANEMFISRLKKEYVLQKDSNELRRNALREIYSSNYWSKISQ